MKILWLTNITLPIISEFLKIKIESRGGWLDQNIRLLVQENKHQICLVSPGNLYLQGKISTNIQFVLFSNIQNHPSFFQEILNNFKPDIVHIHGTEKSHTFKMFLACNKLNYLSNIVLNIQGIASEISKRYFVGLRIFDIIGFSLRDFVKLDNILLQKYRFYRIGVKEKIILKKIKYVIGRTDWDETVVKLANPSINYFKCNETMRQSFYSDKWDLNFCKRKTIFLSQYQYPIKGLHILLKALRYIKLIYPNFELITTGPDLISMSYFQLLKKPFYFRVLRNMIFKFKLEKNVKFLGDLNEVEYKNTLISSNIFVSPSLLENSSNSIAEAMLLGVPIISSNVGGVNNFLKHGYNGFIYNVQDYKILYHYIITLFKNDKICSKFSNNSNILAKKLFNIQENYKNIMSVYDKVL
jgi:glycosyltransferase involved in cell wall biosynthesis